SAALHGAIPARRPDGAIRELLQEARQAHVRALLLLPPEGRFLRQQFPPQRVRVFEAYIEGVARAHGAEVIDARDWVADADLVDGVHACRRGAERLTARLAREVILPRLGPTPNPAGGAVTTR